MLESERLARACFAASRDPDFPRRFNELLHPDVEVVSKPQGGERLRGLAAVTELTAQRADSAVFESFPERIHALDDERVVVEGRLRWSDERRVLRDDPAVWALEFRDGLLYRSIAVGSIAEAEAVLAASRQR